MKHVSPSPSTLGGTGLLGAPLFWERFMFGVLAIATTIPILIAIAMVAVFLYHTWRFFQVIPLGKFLTDTQWAPLFADQHCGIGVLASATLMIVAIALTVAVPLGILSAVYLGEYAPTAVRRLLKPTLEALAGVPTVVYGYFALILLTPFLQSWLPPVRTFNALSAGLMTGVLITPTISSLGEEAIRNVPQAMHEAGYSLGLTRRELIMRIVLPMALPGIIAAVTLAASQALGETMIAAIAAGQIPRLTLNPLVPVSSMTAFIIQVSLGDLSPSSFIFDTVFTVGFVLFLITLGLNWFGHWLVRRFRQQITGMTIPHADSPRKIPLQSEEHPVVPGVSAPSVAAPTQLEFDDGFPLRYQADRLFHSLSFMAALLGLATLTILVYAVAQNGLPRIDWDFFTQLASRNPEDTGIFAALMGTVLLLLLTAIFAFPVGIGAAVFLEEYVPANRWNYWLEIQLANLAAVPSILYGLMGLVLFTRMLRPLTGGRSLLSAGLMMAVLVLPVVVIATRSALRAVPASQRQAGYAIGMGRWQMIRHILLPAAMPGMMTGMLLALSRAAGETAALIAIGAVAFVYFAPDLSWEGLQGGFTTLTTQIFYWASRPQAEFHNLAAATILVLGSIVLLMNIVAVLLRDFYRQRTDSP